MASPLRPAHSTGNLIDISAPEETKFNRRVAASTTNNGATSKYINYKKRKSSAKLSSSYSSSGFSSQGATSCSSSQDSDGSGPSGATVVTRAVININEPSNALNGGSVDSKERRKSLQGTRVSLKLSNRTNRIDQNMCIVFVVVFQTEQQNTSCGW